MAEEDDEDDYMSDKFLQQDTQPGLMPKVFLDKIKRKESSRKRVLENRQKPLKVREAEKREEKLNVSLDESNKGFAMLSKMGFKKGMGLGKEGQGRLEPIPLDLKVGKKGLGREEAEKSKKQKLENEMRMRAKHRQLNEKNLKQDFLDRQRQKGKDVQMKIDLKRCQKCCEQLDAAKSLEMPFPWAWPPVVVEKDEDEEEVEEEDDDEEYEEEDTFSQLNTLLSYLRTTHIYCVYLEHRFQMKRI